MMDSPTSDFWPSADEVTPMWGAPSQYDIVEVLNDEMLSSARGGSPAALQAELAMDMELAGTISKDQWPYSNVTELVTEHHEGSVPGAAADLHTPLEMPVPDEQQSSSSIQYVSNYDGNTFIAHSANMILLPPDTSSGYTATKDGLKQETMQSAMAANFRNRWPEMQRGKPDRNKLAGVFNFSVDAASNRYYSTKLSTLFVDINKNFTIRFKWNKVLLSENAKDVYVRAVVMYGDEAHRQNRVTTCAKHCDFIEGKTPEERRVEYYNVLRSASATGSRGLHYCGARSPPDMWYSVLTPLEEAHAYHMKCWASCEHDSRRRLKQILFILEDAAGTKLGLDLLKVQVCAVPSRDIDTAEMSEDSASPARRKRRAPAPTSASALASASATSDCKRARVPAALTMPPISVATPEILHQTLLILTALTKSSMESNDLTPEKLDAHKRSLKQLKKILKRQM